MPLRKAFEFRLPGVALKNNVLARICPIGLLFCALTFSSSAYAAGPVNAVILFDGPQGAAYIQATGVTLNGKTEVRLCDGISKIDKRTYDNLPRVQLAGATLLERKADGTLSLTANSQPSCVVPANLKFDKQPEFTPSQAAEEAVLGGTIVYPAISDATFPAFKTGVQLVLVTALDASLAEFLRARRAGTVKDWENFLKIYGDSAQAADARSALTDLHEKNAEAAFAQYQKSAAAHQPDIALLKRASLEAQSAGQITRGYAPAARLMESIGRELDSLLAPDRAKLQEYEKALQSGGPGYSKLIAARQHVQQLLEIRADYAPLLNLEKDVATEDQKLEAGLKNAETLESSGRYDEAFTALGPYSSFAGEVPRANAVINADYRYHVSQGQKLAGQQDWDAAAAEFRRAAAIRSDSQEASAALQNAVAQIAAKRDRQAADQAIKQSSEFARENDFIEAYNVLADLPDSQRSLAAQQIATVSRNYVAAASRKAQKIQDVHIPIKGRADEDAVREAYVLLDRASSLSEDPAVTVKRDFLAGKITAYYIDKASRYLEKPLGSGAGVGWLYLRQAQLYGDTLNTVKDQMARYAPVYQRRARLSVGIVIRDQTSRRDTPGFADQLADAIANGLESSGVSVVVVRRPGDGADALQPNFIIVGEVLDHRVVKNTNLETPESKYRAGTHDIKNPAWLQANADYQAAQQELTTAQSALADAQAQHKKKEIIAANADALQAAQKKVDDLRHKLETTDQTRTEAILEPYHYTKKNVDLAASIELSFHINDRAGNVVDPATSVRKTNHKSATVLTDVKPEDTEGATNQGVEPDETQFLADLEIEARNGLVKAVREKISALPAAIFQEARNRAQRGDTDGAAEQYVLYLNSVPDAPSPERDEAQRFLRDQFNLAPPTLAKL